MPSAPVQRAWSSWSRTIKDDEVLARENEESVLADQARDLAKQAKRERLDLKRERLASEQREAESAMQRWKQR